MKFVLARQNENASDLTVAFKMIEDQFGQDLQIENLESGAFHSFRVKISFLLQLFFGCYLETFCTAGPETTEIVSREKKTLKVIVICTTVF
jgi:hypothetical protein